jgi:hypothetical protein
MVGHSYRRCGAALACLPGRTCGVELMVEGRAALIWLARWMLAPMGADRFGSAGSRIPLALD